MGYDAAMLRSQLPGGAFTFSTLPAASVMSTYPYGILAYSSDQGLCVWNGTAWGTVGSGSSSNPASNEIPISSYANVTPGTGTDSTAGLNAAIQATAAAGKTLVIDTNILCSIGTNVSKPIFIPPNCSIRFEPGCAIYYDAVLLPLFVICNSSNVTFENYTTVYIGNYGQGAIDVFNPNGANYLVLSQFNDSSSATYPTAGVKYYMGQNWGNTFSGSGSASSPGAAQAGAQIVVSGIVDNLNFIGTTRASVAAGVTASYFIPMFMSLAPQWLPNTLVTTAIQGASPNNTDAAVPNHVTFDNLELDGYYMGVCGTCTNLLVKAGHAKRYSDLQDNNGNNVGGQTYQPYTLTQSPQSPYTSGTLSTAWTTASASYNVTFSDGSTRLVAFTKNSTNITWSSAVASGLGTTIQVSFSWDWFAPPHAFYVKSWDTANNFPMTTTIMNFWDEGVYVGTPNRRNTGSGYLNSLKCEPANNSSILNYVSNRPDGGFDCQSFGNSGGTVDMVINYNSTTAQTGQLVFTAALVGATSANLTSPWVYGTGGGVGPGGGQGTQTYAITFSNGTSQTGTFVNGSTLVTWPTAVTATAIATVTNTSQGANFWLRFPSSPPMVGLTARFRAVDSATEPAGFGWVGDSQIGNTGIDMEIHYTLNDVPYGSTWSPGTDQGGNNVSVRAVFVFKSMSTTQTYISSFLNSGSTTLTESNIDITVIGWRAAAVSFTASPTGTSATLSSWNYGNGTFLIEFEDGETRQVTVSGTAASWTGALTGSPTATATVLLMNGTNVDSYKNRLLAAQGGKGFGNIITIRDVTNGMTQQAINNRYTETWTRQFMGPVTGASVDTGISFPTTYAITDYGYEVTTALTGPTSLALGWSGATTALISAGAVAANTNAWNNPASNPAVLVPASSDILITPNATITAGALYLSVTGQRSQMSG